MKKNYLQSCSLKLKRIINPVGKLVGKMGVSVYLVGGPVRDILLKRSVLDLDFVVEGDATGFAKEVAGLLKGRVKAYKKFKTATVVLNDGTRVDFSTSRKEFYSQSGALPKVKFAGLKEDLFRRDFSINAMAISVNAGSYGNLIDPCNGWEDTKKKTLRILHKKSFIDDPTRVFRAIRFEQRLGFCLAPNTLKLLNTALKIGYEKNVTPPRYFEEFKKGLNENKPIPFIRRLYKLNALKFICKSLTPNFYRLLLVQKDWKKAAFLCKEHPVKPWIVYLVILLEGLTETKRFSFSQNVQLRSNVRNIIVKASELLSILERLDKPSLKSSLVYAELSGLSEIMLIYLYLCTRKYHVRKYVKQYWEKTKDVHLRITGNDIKAMNIISDRQIGEILNKTLRAKIDGKVNTKREELKFVRHLSINSI